MPGYLRRFDKIEMECTKAFFDRSDQFHSRNSTDYGVTQSTEARGPDQRHKEESLS